MFHGPATKTDNFEEIIFNSTEIFGPVTKTVSNPSKNTLNREQK